MKPKLTIISDLFGFQKSNWIEEYVKLLTSDFQLELYNAPELAGIESSHLSENDLHNQFIDFGINREVNELLKLRSEDSSILGFSIGGTIAWKAALEGFQITNLYAVSATRLRHETEKPNCNIHLLYGENDPFKPEKKMVRAIKPGNELN